MKKHAFTLVEVIVAILIIGIAIASLLAANIAFTDANGSAADLSTAEFLVEQIRELTAPLPYDDLDEFRDKTFPTPIDAARKPLTAFPGFSQHVTVENVSDGDFEQVVANHTSSFVRITATVSLNSRQLTSIRWIRARY